MTEFNSRASILVLVAAFGALAVAARLPCVVAVGMIGAVVPIPFVFPLVAPDEAAIERVRASLPQLPPSAGHRLVIWRFVAEQIGDRPLLSWGMDASRALPGGRRLINDLYPEVTINNRAEALPLQLNLVLWRLVQVSRRGWRRPVAFGYAARHSS